VTEVSSRSRALAGAARQVMPGGVNSGQRVIPGLEDLVIVSASGANFRDADGREYVDFHAAFGPIILGHCDPDVDAAVGASLRSVDLLGVARTPGEVELAELMVEHIPSVESVLLTVTGSEATFHAVRLARAVTGRRLIVKFQGCYHGWHDAVAMNVISAADALDRHDPLSEGAMMDTVEATVVLPFNDIDAVEAVMHERGSEIAAIILEPIPHNVGALLPVPGFLEGLRRLCDEQGTILIFDEVVTGFRHGVGGFQAVAGIKPDLSTFGKAIANGYPIGAIGGRADLMDEFSCIPGRKVFFAGTYNGHPACVAAATATITKLLREPVHDHIFALGERARRHLAQALEDVGTPTLTTGFGSVWVTYFLEPPATTYSDLIRNDADLFVGYRRRQMEDGLFELPLNLKRSHATYAHSEADIDHLVESSRRAILATLAERTGETASIFIGSTHAALEE
jgi:glutamate-1-semialdehyde 2,1-aminomutase